MVGGEHPVGFDDVAVLARTEPVAGIDQGVDGLLHLGDGVAQPLLFAGNVLRDDLPDHHLRLVQNRRTDRQPRVELDPVEPHRQ